MKKPKSLLLLVGILFVASIVIVFTIGAQGAKESTSASPERRADVITIDALRSFGDLEQPAVPFLHELHTNALDKQNKDCTACHLSENDRQSPKFRRLKDLSRQEVMDIYHADCMQCHKETSKAGMKAGPVEKCGNCHLGTPKAVSDRQPMGFDKSLHYRHSSAVEDKCERCHHEYNEETKKLFHAKGEESSCRYCHRQQTEENRLSLKQASHLSCIDCHRKTIAEKKNNPSSQAKVAGPIKCSGCHDKQKQEEIKIIKDVPRLKRNQPNVVLIRAMQIGASKQELAKAALIDAVPFDHRAHEQYNDSCSTCHHADLNTCSSCHTVAGAQEGNYVKSERAMHQINSERSCLGCHASRQSQASCSGCHASIPIESKQQTTYCVQCHMKPPQQGADFKLKPEVMASRLLKSRRVIADSYKDKDIPEVVTINELEGKYEPVYFPHRLIVRRLIAETKDDKLAQYFHREKATICQACHHNSPASKKPPRCYSCHGKPFDAKEPLKPGMKGAYHQQCLGCHKQMGIKKPNSLNCIECHRERQKQEAAKQ